MTPEQDDADDDRVGPVHVVVNHLRLREPVAAATVEALQEGVRLAVDAGALAARWLWSEIARSGLKMDATYLGQTMAP